MGYLKRFCGDVKLVFGIISILCFGVLVMAAVFSVGCTLGFLSGDMGKARYTVTGFIEHGKVFTLTLNFKEMS